MGNSKMNARERIDYLFDDHSFVEVGGYVSARNTDYNLGAKKVEGDGVITGYGVINDRMVYVYSQDASALGGSVGEMHAKKIASLYDLAMKTGAPVIGMHVVHDLDYRKRQMPFTHLERFLISRHRHLEWFHRFLQYLECVEEEVP